MMLLLVLDVLHQPAFFRAGMGERTIPLLPVCELRKHAALLDPSRGSGLDGFHKVGQRHRGMQAGQNVDLIFDPVDAEQGAVQLLGIPQT